MTDYLPKFASGVALTLPASASVTGGRLVSITGSGTVGPSGADALVVGVAGFDSAIGADVTIYVGGVHRLPAAAAIAAGAKVISATGGKVATIGAGANPVGIALTAATNTDDVIDVLFV